MTDTPTEFGVQLQALAYSQEPEAPAPQQHSWRSVVWRAVCLVAGGSLAALVVASAPAHGNHPVHPLSGSPQPVPAVEVPASQVQQDISAALGATAAPVTKAGEFAYILQQGGMLKVVDVNALPAIAESTCNLMQSYDDEALAQRMVGTAANSGDLSIQQARRIVTASRQVYCPNTK